MNTLIKIFQIPELRKRIIFTLSLLAVYRIGVFVTLPGVDRVAMSEYMQQSAQNSFLGLFNMFSGGAIEQLSVFALGIMHRDSLPDLLPGWMPHRPSVSSPLVLMVLFCIPFSFLFLSV